MDTSSLFPRPTTTPVESKVKIQPNQTLKSSMDLGALIQETEKFHYTMDDGNVEMAAGIDIMGSNLIRKAAQEIADARGQKVLKIHVHKVAPGANVPKHRDWVQATQALGVSPCLERWHLPIKTNPQCTWWDEKLGEKHFPVGVWSGPVPYWTLHTIYNRGKEERIHIIVDLDSPKAVGEYQDESEPVIEHEHKKAEPESPSETEKEVVDESNP